MTVVCGLSRIVPTVAAQAVQPDLLSAGTRTASINTTARVD